MSRRQARGVLATIAVIMCVAALQACAATGPAKSANSTGIAFDMLIEHDDSVALYRVADDGTLSFAGGYDARMRRFTWSGNLTSEQIADLRELLEEPIWSEDRRDRGKPETGERRWTVSLHSPLRSRIIVRGEAPSHIGQLEEILSSASARRFADEIDALPRAGPAP